MPFFGTLETMSLPDLLQWLGGARKTGTLVIERNKISKSILFGNGQVSGCSSDDPPERLGHFLLARGMISEEQLREALALQEISGKHLGMILVEMESLSADELAEHLEAKAEEVIYSLFDWNEAVFRFTEEPVDPGNLFPVSLRVEDVLLRGLKRYDEVKRIRTVFNDPGIVLSHTTRRPPAEIFEHQMARTLYESINGDRTVAEILLHVHGSEYIVTKFLFELHSNGFVTITGVKRVEAVSPQAGVTGPAAAPVAPVPPTGDAADEPLLPEWEPTFDAPAGTAGPATDEPAPDEIPASLLGPTAEDLAGPSMDDLEASLEDILEQAAADPEQPAAPPAENLETPPDSVAASPENVPGTQATSPPIEPAIEPPQQAQSPAPQTDPSTAVPAQEPVGVEAIEQSAAHQLSRRLEQARVLMGRAEFEAALDVLDALFDEYPGDESLRQLTAEAETAFIDKAYKYFLPPSRIPVLTRPMDAFKSEKISPTEFFMLSRIDGSWDIKSIIQIAPLREVEALKTLKRMRENGMIDLRDAE